MILAGGEGRRLGGRKAHQTVGGKTLLQRAQAKLDDWRLPYALAVRALSATDWPDGVELLPDGFGHGPVAGVVSALRYARRERFEAVLTIPCDTPLLPEDLVPRLAAALVGNARAAVARSNGRFHPTCALWRPPGSEEDLHAAAAAPTMNALAGHFGAVAVDWPVLPFDPFLNVNTPEDLSTAERLITREGLRQA